MPTVHIWRLPLRDFGLTSQCPPNSRQYGSPLKEQRLQVQHFCTPVLHDNQIKHAEMAALFACVSRVLLTEGLRRSKMDLLITGLVQSFLRSSKWLSKSIKFSQDLPSNRADVIFCASLQSSKQSLEDGQKQFGK